MQHYLVSLSMPGAPPCWLEALSQEQGGVAAMPLPNYRFQGGFFMDLLGPRWALGAAVPYARLIMIPLN